MYNIHLATKINKQLKKQRLSRIKQRNYLETYSTEIKPKLLDNYNKRINTFLRKMQENPVIITQFDQNQYAPHKLFRNFNNQKDKIIGPEKFKFKDHTDWNSIYTEAERSQRKMNEQVMEEKYGDKSLAYRSIASNSEYTSTAKHQFRGRSKDKQINPPMKYVCAVPKIMIRKLQQKKNTSKVRTQPEQQNDKNKNHKDLRLSKQNKSTLSKNSNNLFDEDNRSVRSFRSIRSISDSVNNSSVVNEEVQDDEIKQKEKKMFMSPKIHFKTLVEAFEKCTDQKSKQGMKDVLVKCRIFKVKDKKVAQEVEIDKLAIEIDDTVNTKINNYGKNMVTLK